MATDVIGRYGSKASLLVLRDDATDKVVMQYIGCMDLLNLLCGDQAELLNFPAITRPDKVTVRKVLAGLSHIFYVRRTPTVIGHVLAVELDDTFPLESLYFDRTGALYFFCQFYRFMRRHSRQPILAIDSTDPFCMLGVEKEIFESLRDLQGFEATVNEREAVYEVMSVVKYYCSVTTGKLLVDMIPTIPLIAFLCECNLAVRETMREEIAEDKQRALIEEEEAEAAAAAARNKARKGKKGRK